MMVAEQTFQAAPAGTVLRLAGELDMSTAPLLREALDGHPGEVLCIDMRDVPFMDSMGAHVLANTAQTLADRGCLIIHEPRPNVARVFELLGLTQDGHNIHLVTSNGSS
jgi:anti-anti-sigma factor